MLYRQGEIILQSVKEVKGKKKNHLIIAEGEVTSHKHQITKGDAELYEHEGTMFLKVLDEAELTHEDHKTVVLPKGDYEITIQREYEISDQHYRKVLD